MLLAHPWYEVYDDALPVGGKDNPFHSDELSHRPEGSDERFDRLVEHEQAVQGYAVAHVIDHQERRLTTHRPREGEGEAMRFQVTLYRRLHRRSAGVPPL